MSFFREGFWFLFVLIWGAALISIISSIVAAIHKTRRKTVSSDGHIVPKSEDLTCETVYGHHHGTEEYGSRYIVHEEPTEGYVVLNGIKRKISDCARL